MPIYEYQCSKCGKIHEIWQKISEAPLAKCPDCKGKMERLISATAFALKGSGWYKTDYASPAGKSKEPGKGDKAEKSESGEKSDKPEKTEKAGASEKVEKKEKKGKKASD